MEPNYKVGSLVTTEKENQYTYGDVVVTGGMAKEYWIYRIVALSKDTIEIKNNTCTINGKMNKTDFIKASRDNEDMNVNQIEEELPNKNKIMIWIRTDCPHCELSDHQPVVIPENNYFVLGDNRTGSLDSRLLGCIPIENIKGKVVDFDE